MTMKKKIYASLSVVLGTALFSLDIHAQNFGTSDAVRISAERRNIAMEADGTPQIIVKFKNSESLSRRLIQRGMNAPTPGRRSAVVKDLRSVVKDLRSAASSRVDALAVRAGKSINYRRMLANGADLVSVRGITSMARAIAELESDPAVKWAVPNYMMQPLLTPNDEFYGFQWHYSEEAGGLNLPEAWDVTNGSGAVVAVLDTGFRPHADLVGNIVGGFDFISSPFIARDGDGRDANALDEGDFFAPFECGIANGSNSSWHGTHVSGTVAAVGDNGLGTVGVAFGAKVLPVRVLGRCGGATSDIVDAIVWASGGQVANIPDNPNPADVINMSLGGSGFCNAAYQSAIDTAVDNGAVVVVAAGNDAEDASFAVPANCNNVIAVAATNRAGGRAFYSNFGQDVDVAAPGGGMNQTTLDGVLSTLNSGATFPANDVFSFSQGTSMAAPHVAGVAALLKSMDSSLSPQEVEAIIKSSARDFPENCNGCGTGIVDAAAAVRSLQDQ